MTAALVTEIWNAAAFSASVAPSPQLCVLFWILGTLAAIAYKLGSCFPRRQRQVQHSACCALGPVRQTDSQESLIFVVIPAFIRSSEELRELQKAVNKMSVLPKERIIVVDDGSPITIRLCNCKIARHSLNLGPSAARNTGISVALEQGATSIAFTDADCIPSSDWVSAHASLQHSSPGIWAGRTVASENDLVSQFYNHVGTLMPRLKNLRHHEAIYAPTCNLSVSASIASQVGFDAGFPTSAFEDCDFCVRARNLGHKVFVSSAPLVQHRFQSGVLGLINSYFKYGRSFPIMVSKHPAYESMLEASHPMSIYSWRNID